MKQILFHSIYLSIIAFLGFNYWSSVQAFKAFGILNQQLNVDAKQLDKLAEVNYKIIEKECLAYPNLINKEFLNKTETVIKISNSTIDFIKINKSALHLDSINSLNYEHNCPNNSFINDAKIAEIKNKLIDYRKTLISVISYSSEQKEVDSQLLTTKLINNNDYWKILKYIPLNGVLAELSFLENQIKCDELMILNYFSTKSSGEMIDDSAFKTAIAPKKAVLIEGELFEAEIYLAKYASSTGNNVQFKVNGQALEAQNGIAHFIGKSETIGTKIIKAEAIITNPLTGVKKTTDGYFEYQVLPKCSRDCQ
jgi:hypothetical protein